MDRQHYRPRSVSELIDGTIRIVRAEFGKLVPLALVSYLPMILLFSLMPVMFQREFDENAVLALILGLAVPFVFWFVAFEAAMVHVAGQSYLGRDPSAGSSLKLAASRYFRVLGAFFVKYVAPGVPLVIVVLLAAVLPDALVALLGIASVVAAVMMFLRLVLLPATLLFEDLPLGDAIRRSLALTSGQKWRVFKALLLIYFIWVAIYMVFYVGVIIAFLDSPFVAIAVSQAAGALGYPLFATVTALLYFDFRIRKEAYDIELMTQALPSEAAPSPAV